MDHASCSVKFIWSDSYFCKLCLGSFSWITRSKAFTGAEGSHLERTAQHMDAGGNGLIPGTLSNAAANPAVLA